MGDAEKVAIMQKYGPTWGDLNRRIVLLAGTALIVTAVSGIRSASLAQATTPSEARAIAEEATIYGFPMVDSYRVQYAYFIDKTNPEYKAPWNALKNVLKLYSPDDRAVQAVNTDVPFSFVGADLRTDPLVITVPEVEKDRYYSVQFVDMYTYILGYIGTRATGNSAGRFLLAGPNWKGETPLGVKHVLHSETEFAFFQFRTQLKGPADLENVKRVQDGYKVQPLSAYLGQPAPKPAPSVAFPQPLTPEAERTSLEFFTLLNFLLQFAPAHPSETDLRARFGRIGVGTYKPLDVASLAPEMKEALLAGMADAWADYEQAKKTLVDTGKLTTGDVFGTREYLKNNYFYRMMGAALGIYGNPKEESIYPSYFVDRDGKPLDGNNRYTLRFAPGQLPPVGAFWSVTMYELPSILLVRNPINRYSINSTRLPELKKDADGGLTLYLQNEPPGKDKEANWLPAPKGPFEATMRLYLPKPEALDGRWKAPPLEKAN
ncbi:DUF1254 domain-containing protein (plasmid) [Novosphingobium sp. BL-8A]|uniref:DUF1254 domain-containing protein n=1 Tax=Novosphingobium sp. BL-8A TaxID=3127639 RepID=UPI00375758CE